MCKKESCFLCCSLFSVAGIVFLLLIGVIVQFNTFYVHGLSTKEADLHNGCYYGAAIYGGTFIASTCLLRYYRPKTDFLPEHHEYYGLDENKIS